MSKRKLLIVLAFAASIAIGAALVARSHNAPRARPAEVEVAN